MRNTFFIIVALIVSGSVAVNMTAAASSKVTICHVTGSEKNPFVRVSVDQSAVPAHMDHGDVLQDSNGECNFDPTPRCTGTLPTFGVLYEGDNVALTTSVPLVFSPTADTPTQCEYFCSNGITDNPYCLAPA